MTVFQSSKNYVMVSFLWAIIIFLVAIPFSEASDEKGDKLPVIGIVILYFISGMLIWMLLDTKYRIKNKHLFYCSGFIRGSIEIDHIRKVERWNKWYVTSFIKPALGKDGIVIYYNKFDDIYISPKNKEVFISALLEINPEIEVV